MKQPERMLDLIAAIVRLALKDYAEHYTCRRHPDAEQILRVSGLLRPDGSIKNGGVIPRHATGYRRQI